MKLFRGKEKKNPGASSLERKQREEQIDLTYMWMAFEWAKLSRAYRNKVGCLIVKDGMIISDGFNGTPSGFDNTCEENGETRPEVLHAESNAITKLAKSTNSSDGATLYTILSPCFECSKLIIQSGIKRVVYGAIYRDSDGLTLLDRAGIGLSYVPFQEM